MANDIIKIKCSNGEEHNIVTAGASSLTTGSVFLIGSGKQSDGERTYSVPVTVDSEGNIETEGNIQTSGNINATAYYELSDERLKTFTEEYNINLDDIKNIKTGRFYWNSDEIKVINGGVSAQSVEKYFPELVREDESGIKSVNYDGLAVVAIAAIKKLTERIEQLEDIIRNK